MIDIKNEAHDVMSEFLLMVVFLAVVIPVIIGIGKVNRAVDASNANRATVIKIYNNDLDKTAKQKYVTITQLRQLKNRANNFGSTDPRVKFIYVFDNTRVVDNRDGHVYLVNAKLYKPSLLSKKQVELNLKPVINGKLSEVDVAWKKDHHE